MSKYRSPFSVDYRKPIIVPNKDPRAKTSSLNKYKSRAGAKVIVIEMSRIKPLDLN